MTEEQFDQVIAVHLSGTVPAGGAPRERHCEHRCLGVSAVGMVVQTNSLSGRAGIVGMTKASAKELAHLRHSGKRAIAPG